MYSESDSQESEYTERPSKPSRPPRKKRRRDVKEEPGAKDVVEFPIQALFSVLRSEYGDEEASFERLVEPLLPDLLSARDSLEKKFIERDENGNLTRPLRQSEISFFVQELSKKQEPSKTEAIIRRKLKLEQQRRANRLDQPTISAPDSDLTPLSADTEPTADPEVLKALYDIQTTPFEMSFLARLEGAKNNFPPGLISVDWETRTPWMNLMADIREHYTFAHPEREPAIEAIAPITYSTLHEYHLPQVHDLLERSFWSGIDVSDALDYLPEKTTMVAMYKKVVVGVAIIMSPIQTYITFLAVKSGWDKAQIARTMLFHLISMHPDKDFTLHVSANSSAMLLYNQFGFKAEEFVAGFYSSYLDSNSRASKNAFKLRLRHI
ncbi:Cysteine-rich protein 2-binding protein [Psilocybe cubensis]|uniref:N-acetyltransferase domain-containing protein n=2 Tax=Psilocybe cubensis TaxID=181762 RepID=A0A8H7XVH5_PSICU|nr:Cysteine-rich protein 2-binding protein [Psilocybe cubensis]KAH9479737.1 Cysteine-rich protein 2-binding protein [Psilocybe cubensis]